MNLNKIKFDLKIGKLRLKFDRLSDEIEIKNKKKEVVASWKFDGEKYNLHFVGSKPFENDFESFQKIVSTGQKCIDSLSKLKQEDAKEETTTQYEEVINNIEEEVIKKEITLEKESVDKIKEEKEEVEKEKVQLEIDFSDETREEIVNSEIEKEVSLLLETNEVLDFDKDYDKILPIAINLANKYYSNKMKAYATDKEDFIQDIIVRMFAHYKKWEEKYKKFPKRRFSYLKTCGQSFVIDQLRYMSKVNGERGVGRSVENAIAIRRGRQLLYQSMRDSTYQDIQTFNQIMIDFMEDFNLSESELEDIIRSKEQLKNFSESKEFKKYFPEFQKKKRRRRKNKNATN